MPTPAGSRPAPVERFKPSNGSVVGYLSLAAAVGMVGYLAATEHSRVGLQIMLGLVFGVVVIWTTMLRPRASAYEETLLLRNSLLDYEVPLVLIDTVTVRQTLNVWAGEQRYVCAGYGRSTKALAKRRSRGAMSAFGLDQADERMGAAAFSQIGTSGTYDNFVATRIESLAEVARRDGSTRPEEVSVRRRYAWPELVLLVVTGAAFAGSLFL